MKWFTLSANTTWLIVTPLLGRNYKTPKVSSASQPSSTLVHRSISQTLGLPTLKTVLLSLTTSQVNSYQLYYFSKSSSMCNKTLTSWLLPMWRALASGGLYVWWTINSQLLFWSRPLPANFYCPFCIFSQRRLLIDILQPERVDFYLSRFTLFLARGQSLVILFSQGFNQWLGMI